MKPAALADSGPLYAAVDPDDAHYERSQRKLKQVNRGPRDVVITYPTLLEAYTLVLHRLGDRVASTESRKIE